MTIQLMKGGNAMITSIKGLEYGGKYNKFFWDINNNPLASIKNCLPNCTCFVIGDILSDGLPMPVNPVRNANQWHLYLTNGWTLHNFDIKNVQVGDILEWTNGCHVARVSHIEDNGTIFVSGSFYTGIHGKAMYEGEFDTRDGLNSLKEVSDFMITNYPTRFFHFWTLENENSWVGSSPRYILRQPQNIIYPVERNTNVNQIEVLTNEQRIRNSNNEIMGIAKKGFYNVLDIKHSTKNEYEWYEIAEDRYIAGVEGRVVYLEADNDLKALLKENAELKADIKKIYKIIERWL